MANTLLEVLEALNNLPGFPEENKFQLGDWLNDVSTKPAVADSASLPLVDNQVGDMRVVVAEAAWYFWDGANWQNVTPSSITGDFVVDGTLKTKRVDYLDSGGTLALGGTNASSVSVESDLVIAPGYSVQAPSVSAPSVSTTSIDVASAGALSVGTTTATSVTVGKAGVPLTAPEAVQTPSIDVASAGALSVGTTTATSVTVGKLGVPLIAPGAIQTYAIDVASGTLNVGATTATSITVGKPGQTTTFPGNIAVSGNVNTVGNTTFTDNALFTGDVIIGDAGTDALLVKADSVFDNQVQFKSNVFLGDSAADILTVYASTSVKENAILEKNLQVDGDTTIGSAAGDVLTVKATPLFKENTVFEKDLEVKGNTNIGASAGVPYGDLLNIKAKTVFEGPVYLPVSGDPGATSIVGVDAGIFVKSTSASANVSAFYLQDEGTTGSSAIRSAKIGRSYFVEAFITGSPTTDPGQPSPNTMYAITSWVWSDAQVRYHGVGGAPAVNALVGRRAYFYDSGNDAHFSASILANTATTLTLSGTLPVSPSGINPRFQIGNSLELTIGSSLCRVNIGENIYSGGPDVWSDNQSLNVWPSLVIFRNLPYTTDTSDFLVSYGIGAMRRQSAAVAAANLAAASSRELKDNIEKYEDGLSLVKQLQPASFVYKHNLDKNLRTGFIAEELEELGDKAKRFISYKDKKPTALYYQDMIPLLVNAIKELSLEVDRLKEEINALLS